MEFSDIAAFVAHMQRVAAGLPAVEHRAVEAGAEIIRDEAKKEIGTYQEQEGPFAGWAELADRTKDDRVRQGYTENDPGLRSGEMQESVTCTARGNEAAVGSNDDHLVWFDQGTERHGGMYQPPREVLGRAAFRKAEVVTNAIGGRVVWALRGLRSYD